MLLLFDALYACALCFLPFITFDNVRSSFTKRQDMFPVILALCFVLKKLVLWRCLVRQLLTNELLLLYPFLHVDEPQKDLT